jgi:cytochrome c-type biogenesis protein
MLKKILLPTVLIIFLILLLNSAFAQLDLPNNLKKIADYNKEQALFFSKNLTFLVAFIAGILSFLSPCSIALLPAYFTITFKEKRRITLMTFVFFLGFMPIFIIYGLIASYLGSSLANLKVSYGFITFIIGILIFTFGIITLLGKGFSLFKINKRTDNNFLGVLLFGVFYSVGWSACLGPILAGILLIASVLKSFISSIFLMFSYSLGIFIPLFLFSFLYDKFNLANSILIKGKDFSFGKYRVHSTNLISGVLLILIGLIFIIFKGTSVFNSLTLFSRLTQVSYELQRQLFSIRFINIIGLIVLLSFFILLYIMLKNEIRGKKEFKKK